MSKRDREPGAEATRFHFTKARLLGLAPPPTGRAYYYDTACRGLCLSITHRGARTFFRYGRILGEPVRLLLGRFPEMTLEQARRAAMAATGEIVQGRNPHAERRAERREHTFGVLWDHWLETHAKQHKRPKSWQEDERMYKAFLRRWASRRLSAISKADVASLHLRVGKENGHYAANRLLSLIRAMFNKAADIGFTGGNPAAGIKKFKEESRDRFLRGDELRRFFQSLGEEPEVFQDFFTLSLKTGARRSNVQGMRWADLDLDSGLWRIPGEVAKGGEPIVIPLVAQASEILKRRLKAAGESPWVFPGRGKSGHLVEPKFAWKRIVGRAELTDVRIHDLRRTIASWMAMHGTSLPVIGKGLGHRQVATTQGYARLQVDSVREAFNEAARALEAAATQGETALTENREESTSPGNAARAGDEPRGEVDQGSKKTREKNRPAGNPQDS